MAASKEKNRKNRYKRGGFMAVFDALRYRAGEYSLRGLAALLPRLPARAISGLVDGASGATFRLLRRYRARMEGNLALALGEELPLRTARSAIVQRAWRNFAQSILETTRLMQEPKERIAASIGIEGEEYLKAALAKGRGVIALSAHLGNFLMIGARVVAAGYPFTALVKQPRDRRFAELMDDYRARVGVVTISAKPRREAARGILRALRANAIVLVIADEFKSGGVPVDFFGVPSRAPRGPASLAMRTRAAVVPMFMTRDGMDRLTLRVEPEIELVQTGNLESDVAENTVRFTKCLEAMIRRYPDQWNWLGFKRAAGKPQKREARDDSETTV